MIQDAANASIKPNEDRPFVAIATREGILVNQHLGEAELLTIYAEHEGVFTEIETRITPYPGGGDERWVQLAELTSDCRALLVSGVGPRPSRILETSGLKVVVMEGLIDEALSHIQSGREIRSPIRKTRCGDRCSGDGGGCG